MKRHYLFTIVLFLNVAITFANSYSIDSLTQLVPSSTHKPDSLVRDSMCLIFGDDCLEVLCKGMPEEQYHQMQQITWTPLTKTDSTFSPQTVSLQKYTKYADFEGVLANLSKSSVCKAYAASLSSSQGRKMFAIEIGKGNEVVVFTAGLHAREISNPQFALKFAATLVNNYEKGDIKTRKLLEKRKIVILPCVNPDGYSAVLEGKSEILNDSCYAAGLTSKQILELKANTNGVDINRNFPNYSSAIVWKDIVKTDMISTGPSSCFFPGNHLGDQNETKVTMNFLEKYIPQAVLFIDIHSAGRVIYCGKPHLSDTFNVSSRALGEFVRKQNHYLLFPPEEEVTGLGADGTITDYASEIAAGYQYNALTGRLMPPGWEKGKFVRKYEGLKYNIGIATIETTVNPRGKTTAKPSIAMQSVEWLKFNLYSTLMALSDYAPSLKSQNFADKNTQKESNVR